MRKVVWEGGRGGVNAHRWLGEVCLFAQGESLCVHVPSDRTPGHPDIRYKYFKMRLAVSESVKLLSRSAEGRHPRVQSERLPASRPQRSPWESAPHTRDHDDAARPLLADRSLLTAAASRIRHACCDDSSRHALAGPERSAASLCEPDERRKRGAGAPPAVRTSCERIAGRVRQGWG